MALLLLSLLSLASGCRRDTVGGSPRISPYSEVQHYTLEGPLVPLGLPLPVEQVRLDLTLRDASSAAGAIFLFRDDDWRAFGEMSGSWDGTTMTLHSSDGRGNSARFELAFNRANVRGTAHIYFVLRGQPVRYGVDLGYR